MSPGLNPVIIGSNRALLRRRERPVLHRDERVGERVVVERRVGLEIVCRRAIAVHVGAPFLLQRNPEQRDAPDAVAHHLQEFVNVRTALDVVRQMKVRVVQRDPVSRPALRRSPPAT
jgi:hypothetical protein